MKKIIYFLCLPILLGLSFSSLALTPAHEAFRLDLKAEATQVVAHWTIAPGTYLYQSRLKFNTPEDAPRLAPVKLPIGESHHDADLGDYIIYKKALSVPLEFQNALPSSLAQIPLEIRYQGCSEEGFCYPPTTQKYTIRLQNGHISSIESSTLKPLHATQPHAQTPTPVPPPSLLNTSNKFLLFFGAFALGMVLCFTPCVLPMVPMLSTLIVGKKNLKTFRAFSLSAVYVLSMSLTYAIAGVSAALLGQRIQTAFQSPWVLSAFAGLFIILGLELAGHLNIHMPDFIKSRLYQLQTKSQAGTFLGAIALGILATLVASPCVSAPLMGVLGYITQTGDILFGGLSLFGIGLGMGTPLVIAGTLGGKYLPKTGHWMQLINEIFAVVLFGFAIWILERFIPAFLVIPLWAILCLYIAYKMGGFNLKRAGLLPRVGMLFVAASAFLLFNASPFMSHSGSSSNLLAFNHLSSLSELEKTLAEAKGKGQPTIVEFYADWCTSCKKMEKHTISQAAVQTQLKDWHRVKANVTGNTHNEQALLSQFNLVGPPSILFFDKDGVEQPQLRLTGEVAPSQLIEHLKKMS